MVTAAHTRTRFTGSLRDVAVADLLQTLTMSPKGGVVHLRTDLGNGEIWVADSLIVDARLEDGHGEAALYQLLMATQGNFEMKFKAPKESNRQLSISPQHALMEGLRRLDEWHRDAPSGLAPGARLRVDEVNRRAWYDDLPPDQTALLEHVGATTNALGAVTAAGGAQNKQLRQLSELAARGLVAWDSEPAAAAAVSDPAKPDTPPGGFWAAAQSRYQSPPRSGARRGVEILAAIVLLGTLALGLSTARWELVVGGQLLGWGLALAAVSIQARPKRSEGPGDVLLSPALSVLTLGRPRG